MRFSRIALFAASLLGPLLAALEAVPPVVTLSPPVSSEVPSGFAIVTTGRAGDSDGQVETVEIFANGGLVDEATLEPNGFFFLEWNPVVPGVYSITAEATDKDGDSTVSAPVSFTVVEGTPPVASLSRLPSTVPVGEVVPITGTSGVFDGTIEGVNIYVNELRVGAATVGDNGGFAFDGWIPTVPGVFEIVAEAVDESNLAGFSAPQTVTAVEDPGGVGIAFDGIIPQSVAPGDEVPIEGRVVGPDTSVSGVRIFVSGKEAGSASVGPDGRFSFSWTAGTFGTFGVVARATFADGQIAETDSLPIEVSNGASPVASITPPPAGSVAVGTVSSLIGSVGDSDGLVESAELFVNGGLVEEGELEPSGLFSLGWVPTSPGTAVLRVKVEDEEGFQALSDPVTVTVVEGVPPVVALSPPPVDSFVVGSTITFRGSAGDFDGSVSAVELFADDTLLGTADLSETGVFSFDWTASAPGSFAIRARAVDDRGLTSVSNEYDLTVGSNAPPTVELQPPPSPVTTGSNLRLTATADDYDGNITEVSFLANGNLIGTVEPPARGNPFTVGWVPRSRGTYSLVAVATDNRGASVSSAVRTVEVEQAVGTRPVITPTSLPASAFGRYFLGSTVLLTASASDLDGTVEEVVFQIDGETVATFAGKPFAVPFTFDTTGEFVFTALARDDSGNVSATSVILESLDANRTIPKVSITSPSDGTAVAVGRSIPVRVEADGAGNQLSGIDLVADADLIASSSSDSLESPVSSDVAATIDLRAFAFYERDVSVVRIVDGEEVETELSFVASGISDPRAVRFVDPVSVSGFGELMPVGGWEFFSGSLGRLVFPGGDPLGQWAYAFDIDSWVGALPDGRLWSLDYGFLAPGGSRSNTFESALFGSLSWAPRSTGDSTIWLSSVVYGSLGKPLGTSFFYSPVLRDWLGSSAGGGVFSARFEWVRPVQRFVIESSVLGRLFLQPLQPGTVFSVREGRFLP
ncbi:MAG: Ig-like domain-containing protein [Puniceicoccaceae bacterium]